MQSAIKTLCKSQLLVVVKGLVAPDQNTVLIHAGLDQFECLLIMNLTKIKPSYFRHEKGMKFLK